jgi:hypothetical protein
MMYAVVDLDLYATVLPLWATRRGGRVQIGKGKSQILNAYSNYWQLLVYVIPIHRTNFIP